MEFWLLLPWLTAPILARMVLLFTPLCHQLHLQLGRGRFGRSQ